ncbi:MAG: flagellar basal-body rod modification protein [Geobacteraceae bacterium]|nr:MAG: flagellar basal-body rod modification protein [Geobacteraceae bacterium]
MITDVTSTTDSSSGAAAMKKATGMNKDDFLKLFVTQLQNQDPLNPQDGTQFLGQLAQLTQVEQAYNTNSNLQNMISAQNNASTLSAVSFIGKEVTATGSQVVLTAGGQPALNFRLTDAAQQITVDIKDASGKTVRTLTRGSTAAGDSSITWDGKDGNNQSLPAGAYSFSVTGKNSAGDGIQATSLVQGKVDGLKLDGSTPVLTINGLDVPLTSVLSVKGV